MLKNIFQDSILVSGIMCFSSCGTMLQSCLNECINECIKEKLLPKDAQLIVDAEPNGLGIHQLLLSIQTNDPSFTPPTDFQKIISSRIRGHIYFDIIESQEDEKKAQSNKINWINIIVNLLTMGTVVALALIFPPSILLTSILTALSFFTTAFTCRNYLLAFFRNVKTGNLANMATTISLGWFLSLAHTLFHAITMPLASSFSMVFMDFIMPVLLITCINGMDEIKRLILTRSQKMQLKGINTLFPQMAKSYYRYELSQNEAEKLATLIKIALEKKHPNQATDLFYDRKKQVEDETDNSNSFIMGLLQNKTPYAEEKSLLQEGMLIQIEKNQCFPVDCVLIQGTTIIDASLLTGEPQQNKKPWQKIPAGAVNLDQPVTVYALKNPYNSTVNSLLFRSNRENSTKKTAAAGLSKFTYLYTGLILVGILGAILTPVALGIVTFPIVMQNVIGILFSVCPCTVAIAHQLPELISMHHRNNKKIHLRDESLLNQSAEMHTIVFDKTGTLTTGKSEVESSDIQSAALWQRIYLLEKNYGREHPLAKAIQRYYQHTYHSEPLFNDVTECEMDAKNRGLCARVQNKLVHIGSPDYLRGKQITVPVLNQTKINQGYSAVCVAEEGNYQGTIYIKHEVRQGVVEALTRLKNEGKKIIMLTGDELASARGFNKQINSIFSEDDIYAEQTPENKEAFLNKIMKMPGADPKGVWFVGDGLNDAPCCRIVSENGGISCAMDQDDKSAFFTDICLNGSLNYLFQHNQINNFLKQSLLQNKGILVYSTVAFLAFIISFSIAGIAVSPLIPVAIMLSTTFFVLFNSYRNQFAIDDAFDEQISWPRKLLASNFSIGLLLGASALLMTSVLIATIATGGLALPLFAFTAGVAACISSVCSIAAISLAATFITILATFLLSKSFDKPKDPSPAAEQQRLSTSTSMVYDRPYIKEEIHIRNLFQKPSEHSAELQADDPKITV